MALILSKTIKEFLRESNEPDKKTSKLPTQKMILSDNFRKLLNTMLEYGQSNISKRLLELETEESDKLFDYSYVDIDDNAQITFLTSQRIDRLKSQGVPETEFWTNRLRQSRELRRFITQTLPSFSKDSIDKFYNKFKALMSESVEEDNFELVEGEDIIFWYNRKNYEEAGKGTLGNSCMADKHASKFLNCYAFNPNQCKMLILKSKEEGKIKGRALVWKLSKPENMIFMDRIYVNDLVDEQLFINYARRQGWAFKDKQKYGETDWVYKGEKKEIQAYVKLDNTKYDLYPYVDTLRYFFEQEKVMANYMAFNTEHITLTDTEGHYEEWNEYGDDYDEDYDPMVFDAYNGVEIPEGRATWCEYDNGYINTNDAIRLAYNGKYAFPNSPHIVFSDYTNKWYAKVDCEFSKPLNTWIWNKYMVDVYHDKEKTSKDRIHRFELNKTIGKIGDDYYDIDLLVPVDKKTVIGKDGKSKTEVTYEFKQ